MVNSITLNKLTPNVFSDVDLSSSGVWGKTVTFSKGQKYLIAAESGSGKSSLLDYIYGRRTDYIGQVLIDDVDIQAVATATKQQLRREELSVVFQGLRLFPELTAWENVALKNRLTNHKTSAEIESYFERLGIKEKQDEKVRTLSFGQQQRIAIIRALCQPFSFLMLDEPFGHLDRQNIQLALSLAIEEAEKQQAGILLFSLGFDYGFSYTTKLSL